MAVNPASLASTLAGNFAAPGASVAECAGQWADAMVSYASAVVPPSLTVAAAGSALRGALAAAFATPGGAAPGMESGFLAFAATVGAGMAPAFVGAPPPAPVGFASLVGGLIPTHAAAAAVVAGKIQAWFLTGTATPSVGGPPVPWT